MKTQHAARRSSYQHDSSPARSRQHLPALDATAVPCDAATLTRGIQQAKQTNRTYLVAHYQERLRQLEWHNHMEAPDKDQTDSPNP